MEEEGGGKKGWRYFFTSTSEHPPHPLRVNIFKCTVSSCNFPRWTAACCKLWPQNKGTSTSVRSSAWLEQQTERTEYRGPPPTPGCRTTTGRVQTAERLPQFPPVAPEGRSTDETWPQVWEKKKRKGRVGEVVEQGGGAVVGGVRWWRGSPLSRLCV